jgi:pimeloyl-ACP methyl ester carboxylesterase
MYASVANHKTFFSTGSGAHNPEFPSVIFLHGAGMDHTIWVLASRYFARHNFNVFAFDFPGHGRSEGPLCQSIDEFSDWLDSASTELNINEAAIVGHSMGSLVALNFAARYSQKARSLALLGTSTPMQVADQLLDASRNNHHDAIDMANTWSHSNFSHIGGNESPGLVMTLGGQRLLERAKNNVLFTDLNACNKCLNGAELAANISCESLILVGTKDRMTTPIKALKLAELIPGSRTTVLEQCGHSMISEQPNAVLDALITIV